MQARINTWPTCTNSRFRLAGWKKAEEVHDSWYEESMFCAVLPVSERHISGHVWSHIGKLQTLLLHFSCLMHHLWLRTSCGRGKMWCTCTPSGLHNQSWARLYCTTFYVFYQTYIIWQLSRINKMQSIRDDSLGWKRRKVKKRSNCTAIFITVLNIYFSNYINFSDMASVTCNLKSHLSLKLKLLWIVLTNL